MRPEGRLHVTRSKDGPHPTEEPENIEPDLVDLLLGPMAQAAEEGLDELLRQIDRLVSDQLNEILHHPKFQSLEGSWRGLQYLLDQTDLSPDLKVKVMSVTKQELQGDLMAGSDEVSLARSKLFHKIRHKESNRSWREPYGVLIGDYEFGRDDTDVELLARISQVAASARAPFLASAAPSMFGLGRFTELGRRGSIASAFDGDEYARWDSYRASEDSRFVALTVPRILIREPYGEETVPVREFAFEEDVGGGDHEKLLWSNATWALGACIGRAFATYGWCARIRGIEHGGLVEGLPTHKLDDDPESTRIMGPTDAHLAWEVKEDLAGLGFIALAMDETGLNAVFFDVPSTQKTGGKPDTGWEMLARVRARLSHVFSASRFVHYLRAMVHDYAEALGNPDALGKVLNEWISGYRLLDEDAPDHRQAMFPLRGAVVDVVEDRTEWGDYCVLASIRPGFQLISPEVKERVVIDRLSFRPQRPDETR
jgi:type VI secretion system protein ImpC